LPGGPTERQIVEAAAKRAGLKPGATQSATEPITQAIGWLVRGAGQRVSTAALGSAGMLGRYVPGTGPEFIASGPNGKSNIRIDGLP
jgi:hypothetical protein